MTISQGLQNTPRRKPAIVRTLIFLYSNQKVLLIKGHSKKRIGAGLYNGIGGHVESGEHPYDCALREMREETGIVLNTPLAMRGTVKIEVDDAPQDVMLIVYTAQLDNKPALTPSTEGDLAWVDPAELTADNAMEDLPQLLNTLQKAKQFSARYWYTEGKLNMDFNITEPA